MVRDKISLVAGIAMFLALVSVAQPDGPREGSLPPTMVAPVPPQPPGGPGPMLQMTLDTRPGPGSPGGPGPMPMMRMKELADQLRARAREAQELSDRLRRQADELDQMAMRQMGPRPGPQPRDQVQRELRDIFEAIGRAEREGRRQEADELHRRAQQLIERFYAMPPGVRPEERQEIKRQIERLRDEAQRVEKQGRVDEAKRIWQEADRLEQRLREPGPREGGEPGRPMPPEVQDILRAAEQAEREGRMEDARRQREKAEMVARQLQEQKGQGPEAPDRSFKDEIIRGMEGLKKEIGRLWQAVNEMRNRPREG